MAGVESDEGREALVVVSSSLSSYTRGSSRDTPQAVSSAHQITLILALFYTRFSTYMDAQRMPNTSSSSLARLGLPRSTPAAPLLDDLGLQSLVQMSLFDALVTRAHGHPPDARLAQQSVQQLPPSCYTGHSLLHLL